MRCRECGLELDARDRLPNGAYQCPECGAIYHTASSSRVSPSPWRRKRSRNPFGSAADMLTERRLGLPLWAWIVAVVLVLVLALVLILNLTGGKGDPTSEGGAGASPTVEASAAPGDLPEEAGGEDLPDAPENTPITVNSTTNLTGVRVDDFTVGFDWAMSKLKYNDTLQLKSSDASTTGDTVSVYTFQDWFTLQMVIVPDSEVIRSAVATGAFQAGSADNTRILGALAATMYALDNTITPNFARNQLVKMVSNPSEYCDRTGFSAKFTSTSSSEYVMEFDGKL